MSVVHYMVITQSGSKYFVEDHSALFGGHKWYLIKGSEKLPIINFSTHQQDLTSNFNPRLFLPGHCINAGDEKHIDRITATSPIKEIWQRVH